MTRLQMLLVAAALTLVGCAENSSTRGVGLDTDADVDSGTVDLELPQGFRGFFSLVDTGVDNAMVIEFRDGGSGQSWVDTCDSDRKGPFQWRMGDAGVLLVGHRDVPFARNPDGGTGLVASGHAFLSGSGMPDVETWREGAVCPGPCTLDGGAGVVSCAVPLGWDGG